MKKENGTLIIRVAAYSALLQLFLIVAFSAVVAIVGTRPEMALEAFESYKTSRLAGLIKDEILIITMIALYLFTFLGLYEILKDDRYDMTRMAVLLTFVSVALAIASHSGFSMMHLADRYHSTTDEAVRSQLLAAGEAVLSRNMWHSTSSYFTGIMLQGSGIMISVAMMGHRSFRRVTGVSGILGNGFDLIQHVIHPILPAVAGKLLMVAGPFYFIWYIMLGLDMFRYLKSRQNSVPDQLV